MRGNLFASSVYIINARAGAGMEFPCGLSWKLILELCSGFNFRAVYNLGRLLCFELRSAQRPKFGSCFCDDLENYMDIYFILYFRSSRSDIYNITKTKKSLYYFLPPAPIYAKPFRLNRNSHNPSAIHALDKAETRTFRKKLASHPIINLTVPRLHTYSSLRRE